MWKISYSYKIPAGKREVGRQSEYLGTTCIILFKQALTLNIPSLGRQRCLPSWGPLFVISQLFDAVDYSNYVFWVSETIIQ